MQTGLSQFIRENACHYPTRKKLVDALEDKFGVSRKRIGSAISDMQKGKHPIVFNNDPIQVNSNVSFHGLSEQEIRAKHDTKFILSGIVRGLEKGFFVPDCDFIKQCDIKNHSGFRQVLDDNEFKPYRGKAQGTTYWGHPESIRKMKEEGILT